MHSSCSFDMEPSLGLVEKKKKTIVFETRRVFKFTSARVMPLPFSARASLIAAFERREFEMAG